MQNPLIHTPAVTAELPATHTSDKYLFMPTNRIIDAMHDAGYHVSSANQVHTARASQKYVVPHIVRLRHKDAENLFGSVPEIVISNSHNGSKPLELMSGIFRFVCANGLIVGTKDASIKLYHRTNNTMDAVFDGVKWIVEQTNQAFVQAEEWQKIKMSEAAKDEFTRRVSLMMKSNANAYDSNTLLPNRYNEESNLWSIFNSAQESLTRGGMPIHTTNARARGVSGVGATVNMNRSLWNLAAEFANA